MNNFEVNEKVKLRDREGLYTIKAKLFEGFYSLVEGNELGKDVVNYENIYYWGDLERVHCSRYFILANEFGEKCHVNYGNGMTECPLELARGCRECVRGTWTICETDKENFQRSRTEYTKRLN